MIQKEGKHSIDISIYMVLQKLIFGDLTKLQFLDKNMSIQIDFLRNLPFKNVQFYILYVIRYQVTTETCEDLCVRQFFFEERYNYNLERTCRETMVTFKKVISNIIYRTTHIHYININL